MDTNGSQSYTLNKYTIETKKRIKERILNEKYENEINNVQRKAFIQKLFETKSKKRRDSLQQEETVILRQPNKYLEAGRNLPLKYAKHFSSELSGMPLEEIDDFYKTDYVRNVFSCLLSTHLLEINFFLSFEDIYCCK